MQDSNLKFQIEKGVFLLGMQRVQGVLDKRGASTAFTNVLLEGINPQRICITATDLEIGIKGTYPANLERYGGVTVSGRKLLEIVRELPEGNIDIEVEDGKHVTIRSKKSFFRIAGASKEDFPILPQMGEEDMVLVDSMIIQGLIGKTFFAVADVEPRQVLTGALLEIEKTGSGMARIRMVGTDGHRLAICERDIEDRKDIFKMETPRQLIIPKRTILELRRLLDRDEKIWIGFTDKQISFKGEEMLIISRLIEGNYPNYRQVLPNKGDHVIRIKRTDFNKAIRRVSVMSREKTRVVMMEFSTGKATLKARDPEIGEATEDIEVDYKGEGLKIGLNYQYLLDALEAVEDEEVIIETQSSLNPCVIKQEGDPGSLCLIMPMRVLEVE